MALRVRELTVEERKEIERLAHARTAPARYRTTVVALADDAAIETASATTVGDGWELVDTDVRVADASAAAAPSAD